jgi:hypothetical protein
MDWLDFTLVKKGMGRHGKWPFKLDDKNPWKRKRNCEKSVINCSFFAFLLSEEEYMKAGKQQKWRKIRE